MTPAGHPSRPQGTARSDPNGTGGRLGDAAELAAFRNKPRSGSWPVTSEANPLPS
jgi:hypothetical protein